MKKIKKNSIEADKPNNSHIVSVRQDSVFYSLFRIEKYRFELYRSIHPEDQDVKPEDVKLYDQKQELIEGHFINYLCITAKNRCLMFLETQSSFSPNFPLFLFFYSGYLGEKYITTNHIDIDHDELNVPDCEVYVIYSGEDKNIPNTLNLIDIIPSIGLKVEVLTAESQKDKNIIYQYERYCAIAREKFKIHPNDMKQAICETITECFQENILVDFLSNHWR